MDCAATGIAIADTGDATGGGTEGASPRSRAAPDDVDTQ
jgi:hypothetical protein